MERISNQRYLEIEQAAEAYAQKIAPRPKYDPPLGAMMALAGAYSAIFLFCIFLGIDFEGVQWQSTGAALVMAAATFAILRHGKKGTSMFEKKRSPV